MIAINAEMLAIILEDMTEQEFKAFKHIVWKESNRRAEIEAACLALDSNEIKMWEEGYSQPAILQALKARVNCDLSVGRKVVEKFFDSKR